MRLLTATSRVRHCCRPSKTTKTTNGKSLGRKSANQQRYVGFSFVIVDGVSYCSLRVCRFPLEFHACHVTQPEYVTGRIPIPGVSSAHYAWSEIQLVPEIWKIPGSSACRDLSIRLHAYMSFGPLDTRTPFVFPLPFSPFRLRYPSCQLSTWRCSASAFLTAFVAISRKSSSSTLPPPTT